MGPAAVLPSAAASDRALTIERVWKCAIAAVLFYLLFYPEIIGLVSVWKTPKESHGILIPAFSLYFLYQDRFRLKRAAGRPTFLGLLVILGCLFVYLYSVFKGFGYPRQVMMIGVILGIVLQLGGWPILRVIWLPILFLLFAIPLPGSIYYTITMPMRELASWAAAVLLNLIPGVDCESAGVLIHGFYQGESFSLNVAEACSGIRLLMTFVALGVVMAYLEYRPILQRLILVGSTIPIAIFCNMIRVIVTGLIHIFLGAQYASGTLHTALGLAMLVVAFGLYGFLAWLMNRLWEEEDRSGILVVGSGEGRRDA